jgi:hypothetical protein
MRCMVQQTCMQSLTSCNIFFCELLLQECPPQASACPAQQLDYCTVKGSITSSGDKLEPVASGTRPARSCTANSDCETTGFACSMANPTRVCTCANSTGAVSCQMYGTCERTPCKVCSDCVASLQDYVNNTSDSDNSSVVAGMFQSECVKGSSTQLMCAASAAFIQSSNRGNLGRRAGALCSMLGG